MAVAQMREAQLRGIYKFYSGACYRRRNACDRWRGTWPWELAPQTTARERSPAPSHISSAAEINNALER